MSLEGIIGSTTPFSFPWPQLGGPARKGAWGPVCCPPAPGFPAFRSWSQRCSLLHHEQDPILFLASWMTFSLLLQLSGWLDKLATKAQVGWLILFPERRSLFCYKPLFFQQRRGWDRHDRTCARSSWALQSQCALSADVGVVPRLIIQGKVGQESMCWLVFKARELRARL